MSYHILEVALNSMVCCGLPVLDCVGWITCCSVTEYQKAIKLLEHFACNSTLFGAHMLWTYSSQWVGLPRALFTVFCALYTNDTIDLHMCVTSMHD